MAVRNEKEIRNGETMRRSIYLMAIFVSIIIMLTGCGKKTIDMSEYVTVAFSGYNTRCTADVVVNYDALAGVLASKKTTDMMVTDLSNILRRAVKLEYEEMSNLCNGDDFEITVALDDYLFEIANFTVKSEQLTYTVDGLKEATMVDVFADLRVTFSGYSPNGSVAIENLSNDVFIQNLTYNCLPSGRLSNGDVVTILVTCSDSLIEKFGCIPSETKREYVVSDLGYLVESNEQVDEDVLGYLRDDNIIRIKKGLSDTSCAELVAGLCEQDYGYSWTWKYAGSYDEESIKTEFVQLLTPLEGSRVEYANICAVVGSFHITLTLNGETVYDDIAYTIAWYYSLRVNAEGVVETSYANWFKESVLDKVRFYSTLEACREEIEQYRGAYVIWGELLC